MTKTRPKDVPLPAKDEVLLTRLEACWLARIGLTTFDRAVNNGLVRVHRIGRKVMVAREELHRFIGIDAAST